MGSLCWQALIKACAENMDAMLKSLLTPTPSTNSSTSWRLSASEASLQNVEESFGDGVEDSRYRWQQLQCLESPWAKPPLLTVQANLPLLSVQLWL
ncbi:unnamed protein product [Caretta caretta]